MTEPGMISGVLIILFGVVNCFFGYGIFRLLLGIWGFLLGGGLALNLVSDAPPVTILVVGAVGAVVGALLIYFLFRVGLFIIGTILGYTLTVALLTALGISENVLLLALVGALVFGLLALLMDRVFIIVLTAFSGASTIVTGVSLLLDPQRVTQIISAGEFGPAFAETPALVGVIWLLLAISGMMVQYRSLED